MKDKSLLDFFYSLIDDKIEKEIVDLILQGKDEEEIVENLLRNKKSKK